MSVPLFGVIFKDKTLKVLVITKCDTVTECMPVYLPTRTSFALFQGYAMYLISWLLGTDLILSCLVS